MKKITQNCTGCSACKNICPKKAITLKGELFNVATIDQKKCIDCNLCKNICPSNKNKEDNNVQIKVARLKNKNNIIKSTSGGLFGELARYVLSQNGIVYGAKYSDDYMSVEHTRCDSIKNLNPLLKSKYVRSNMGNTYKETEEDLKSGKTVLYSGTPCQVAGLKCYLKRDYENLYTVDIICHGTPSPAIWKKYATYLEKKAKSKITYVDFRHFDKKQPTKNFLVKYDNGKETLESLYDTSYGRAFLVGLINDDCCNNCKFNDFKQYSDITLGDAWGYINKKYPNKNSLILLNTDKGKKLYKKISIKLKEFDDYSIESIIKSGYPIIHSTFSHYNKDKINLNAKNIDKELWHWLDEKNGLVKDKKGVGILNFHYENYNYGANLVAYSLSEVIKKIGYNPYVIDFDPFDDLDSITRYQTQNLYKFRKQHLNMTPRFKDAKDLKMLNDYLDMYVVGSDQVWRKAITRNNILTYFLDFAKNKNKISYAASFGKDEFEGDSHDQVRVSNLLKQFYKVSVRENAGIDICKNLLEVDSQVTLDPTLLLSAEDYEKIIDDEYKEKVDVAVYFVMDHENIITENKHFKRLFPNKNVVNIKGEYKEKPFGKVFVYNSVSKWIDGIRKADYVVTDSYHGLLFSLIFNKRVICIGKKSASYSRFQTLIDNLQGNIDKVIYSDLKDVKSKRSPLKYDEINKNISIDQNKSIEFLKENLGPKKIKKVSPNVEILDAEITKYTEENKQLLEQLNFYKDEYFKMINSRSWKMTRIIRAIKRRVRK